MFCGTETETERLRLSIMFVSSETGTKISVSVSKISVFQYLQKLRTQGLKFLEMKTETLITFYT